MSQLRAFLAIDIDEDLKAKIYKVIKEFKQIDANIKYVDLENLHLTLKFFGDIDTEGIDLLSSKISDVVNDSIKGFTSCSYLATIPVFLAKLFN